MTTLPVQIDDATARAYEAATAEERARLVSLVNVLFRSSLSGPKERLEVFRRAADATGREAQANGWTDELDAALLRGDFDHEA